MRLVLLFCLALPVAAERVAVIISANAEWRVVRSLYPKAALSRSPYGEFFVPDIAGRPVVVLQGGWGKVDAAASAQYAIGRWNPEVVFNLGTCGGIAGQIQRHEIVLAERTVIYDIVEMMGDSAEAIRYYTTAIDLAWLGAKLPTPVRRGVLVSADRDLSPADIPKLRRLYRAVAADWESGAIARVARQNGKRVVILRGVSDLVGANSGEAYGKPEVFAQGTEVVMKKLFEALPAWIAIATRR
jgi:adenosylhomocysteine nucleosidase